MGISDQGSKPRGRIGFFIGRLMNIFHTGFYRKYYNGALNTSIDRINGNGTGALPPVPAAILDNGCGGGQFLKYLSRKNDDYSLFGLDHSDEMVKLSRKVNRRALRKGQIELQKGSVTALPYANESMDLVTAHETVQFWPNIHKSFTETHRILKEGGAFLIINRYPEKGTRWYDTAKLKSEDAFRSALKKAGFSDIQTDLSTRKGWIIARAKK